MVRLYLYLAATLMLFLVVIINHNNFTYAETNITINNTTANGSNTNFPSYLMNQSNYFFVKYIQSDWKTGNVNKTAQYDSNQNAVTVEYKNSTYYTTLTDKQEKSLKLALLDINFFRLPSDYPMTFEAPTENINAYNLTATIFNKTNSVYWTDKQNETVPSGLTFLKDRIEGWLQNASLNKQENPTTSITPSCGPIEGFNFKMMTNGFAPNRTVHWELLDKDHQPALLGYFETNSTGGFNQTSDVSQIMPGKYQLHVFDDVDNDAHADFVGKETFTTLSFPCEQNNNATSAQASGVSGNASITVNPAAHVNTPPVANAQFVTITRDTAASINLNATDKDGDSLNYSLTSLPKQGSLSSFDKNTGSVVYTPKSGYTGNDGFTFTANDKSSTSNTANVSISVNPATPVNTPPVNTPPVNTPPVAKSESVTTNRDMAASINLDATDKDGDSLTYSLTSSPKQGSLSSFDKNTGTVVYTPKSGYTGNDGFTFTANDKSSTSNSAKVSITVNSVSSGTSKAFSMAAVGDWGCTSNTDKTVKKISSEKPNIVLALGDYSYEPSADCWLKAVKPIDDITKITIGNHEDSPNEDLDAYMSNFGMNKQFYSFTKNNVHFVVMATEIPYKSSSDQYKFVVNDLSKASMDKNVDWIVVFMHRIMYTSPTSCSECDALSDLRETYQPLFDKYGVDLVLQGHAHDYQRSYPLQYDQKDEEEPIVTDKNSDKYNDPKGEIYIIAGTGGEDFHALKSKSSFIASQHDIRFGHLNLDTSKSGSTKILKGRFIGNDGKIMDEFQILNHQ
jgi:predicted MPP superfamily phosphohydrolase